MLKYHKIEYDHIEMAYQQLYWGVDEVNLSKLFEMQRKLDERIIKEKGLEGQDLLPNKILALQVELGELANEWQGFKHWKINPQPKEHRCPYCSGTGYVPPQSEAPDCWNCGGTGTVTKVLEEYVDCLHFVLSIGLEIGYDIKQYDDIVHLQEEITMQFTDIFHTVSSIYLDSDMYDYQLLLYEFIGLGEMLGFTWEQIEQAYMDKNKVNHERQANGY